MYGFLMKGNFDNVWSNSNAQKTHEKISTTTQITLITIIESSGDLAEMSTTTTTSFEKLRCFCMSP